MPTSGYWFCTKSASSACSCSSLKMVRWRRVRRCEPGPPAPGGAPEPPVGAAKGKGAAGPSLSGHGSRAPAGRGLGEARAGGRAPHPPAPPRVPQLPRPVPTHPGRRPAPGTCGAPRGGRSSSSRRRARPRAPQAAAAPRGSGGRRAAAGGRPGPGGCSRVGRRGCAQWRRGRAARDPCGPPRPAPPPFLSPAVAVTAGIYPSRGRAVIPEPGAASTRVNPAARPGAC